MSGLRLSERTSGTSSADKELFSYKYLNQGLEHEQAPRDTLEALIKDGIETIRAWTF